MPELPAFPRTRPAPAAGPGTFVSYTNLRAMRQAGRVLLVLQLASLALLLLLVLQ